MSKNTSHPGLAQIDMSTPSLLASLAGAENTFYSKRFAAPVLSGFCVFTALKAGSTGEYNTLPSRGIPGGRLATVFSAPGLFSAPSKAWSSGLTFQHSRSEKALSKEGSSMSHTPTYSIRSPFSALRKEKSSEHPGLARIVRLNFRREERLHRIAAALPTRLQRRFLNDHNAMEVNDVPAA